MAIRLALRGFRAESDTVTQKPAKYWLRALFTYSHHFKEPLFRLTARARAFVSDQPYVFASGRQDLGRKKACSPKGANKFFQQNRGAPTAGWGQWFCDANGLAASGAGAKT